MRITKKGKKMGKIVFECETPALIYFEVTS